MMKEISMIVKGGSVNDRKRQELPSKLGIFDRVPDLQVTASIGCMGLNTNTILIFRRP